MRGNQCVISMLMALSNDHLATIIMLAENGRQPSAPPLYA